MLYKQPPATISTQTDERTASLTITAHNPVVAWFIMAPAWLVTFGLAVLALVGVFKHGTLEISLLLAIAAGLVFWFASKIAFRPKSLHIVFDDTGIGVGATRYGYGDITSFGISAFGGAADSPFNMPVPRNVTQGPHLYIEVGGRHIPITVGLRDAQARDAFDAFETLYRRYSAS